MEDEEFKARTPGAAKAKAEQGIFISDTPIVSSQEPCTNNLDRSQGFKHTFKHKPRLHLVQQQQRHSTPEVYMRRVDVQ